MLYASAREEEFAPVSQGSYRMKRRGFLRAAMTASAASALPSRLMTKVGQPQTVEPNSRRIIETLNGTPPVTDSRSVIRGFNTPFTLPSFKSKEDWIQRRDYLRRHVLSCAGLWPEPPKTPLRQNIFGRIERREGYTVELVHFESYPGFFVTGNLYRPRKPGGPFPGILCPHGHWNYGRLENNELTSVPARVINFALQGYVVFTYDMIGFNDSTQINHGFGGEREHLWGINSLGLHLWNSIRAVDFLQSLTDVDPQKIGCTGASGGATQAFLLTAVDDRIKVSAPVNMISAHMQGGDTCENAPNLRIDASNVEIGALMAPRPLLIVSATGDWTSNTLEVEYPAIRRVYDLLGEGDKVRAVRFDAEHNYNRQSREAVYAWFGRWLLGVNEESQLKEKPYNVEMPSRVLVFFGRERPPGVTPEGLTSYLIDQAKTQSISIRRTGRQSLDDGVGSAFRHAVMASEPGPSEVISTQTGDPPDADTSRRYYTLSRPSAGDRISAIVLLPVAYIQRSNKFDTKNQRPRGESNSSGSFPKRATLLIHPEGKDAVVNGTVGQRNLLVDALLAQGSAVMSIDCFQTGSVPPARNRSERYFTTYNRTDDVNRVQDILTAVAYLRGLTKNGRVELVGLGKAGPWCLLAAALAKRLERVAADFDVFEIDSDPYYLKHLYIPGLRRAGDFRTAVALAAPNPLLIHNLGDAIEPSIMQVAYQTSSESGALIVEREKLSDQKIANWLSDLNLR